MFGQLNRALALAALASFGGSIAVAGQTQADAATTTPAGHIAACESPLVKLHSSPKADGTCPFGQQKFDWSRYALLEGLDAEVAARIAADAALQAALIQVQQAVGTSVTQALLEAEAAARSSGDAALQASIDAEVAQRGAADVALQTAIDAETAARANADNVLQANIAAEAAARNGADVQLQANIDAEAAARTNGDAVTLQQARAYTDSRVGSGTPGSAPSGTLYGVEVVTESRSVPAGTLAGLMIACPSGKISLGGGWHTGSAVLAIRGSTPSQFPDAWRFSFFNSGTTSATVQLYATCASLTP